MPALQWWRFSACETFLKKLPPDCPKIVIFANESDRRYSVWCVREAVDFARPAASGKFCGDYSLGVEISGFTFDGNLTTQSFKIRAVYEGLLTMDFLCEIDLRSLFSLFWREKPRHSAHSFKRRMYRGTQGTATDGPKWRNGRRRGFKIPRLNGRAGSSPALGTTKFYLITDFI